MSLTKRFALDAPLLGLYCSALCASTHARAEEPRKLNEPRVLKEPAEVTQVSDAFDDDNVFDLNLSLGYESTWTSSVIRRDSSIGQPAWAAAGSRTAI